MFTMTKINLTTMAISEPIEVTRDQLLQWAGTKIVRLADGSAWLNRDDGRGWEQTRRADYDVEETDTE